MKFKKLGLACLAAVATVTLASCGEGNDTEKVYTYNDFTAVSPSNWNELTYQDENDTQIMSFIGSSFFAYDFKYDSNGKIVSGEFEMEYSAATKLEDVTSTYAGKEAYSVPADATKNYAYKITLREDLKWDDGTAITADDFVYTMQQQLDPEFQNYRADSYYAGATVIHNAENYLKQGKTVLKDNYVNKSFVLTLEDLTKGADGVYNHNGAKVKFNIKNASNWCGGDSLADYADDLNKTAFDQLLAKVGEDGYADITDETIELLTQSISTEAWQESAANVPCYIAYEYTYGEVDFEDVGIFVGSTPYEIVLVLDLPLELLKEDGSLSYQAAYNMASLPLVHKTKYEANKVKPVEGSTLWTSTYNSSVDSTASWGPYKLVSFQAGKEYVLERNENWFGYNLDQYEGQYQTDRIVCETIKDYETQLMKFKKGELTSIGIDVTVANTYKNSEQAIYTPDDYVGSLQLQSSRTALEGRQKDGINKTILCYEDFRKAISLCIDRVDYNQNVTTSSKAGFGLFNTMHYYNVEEGLRYRDTDDAKKTLCETYAVDYTKFASLDAAVESITGYNLELARQLVDKAYDAALAAGDIKAGDKVELVFGTGAINESTQRQYDYLSNCLKNLVSGTKLDGRLETKFEDHGTKWAEDFRSGGYDICTGGWSGAAWDPGYFLLAYLSPAYMYSVAWDTSTEMVTFTVNGEEKTMSAMDWYMNLNGMSGCQINMAKGFVDDEVRIALIATLEKVILTKYYTVPIQNHFSSALLSYKVEYATRDYNTFMAYGGIRYLTYNYSDAEWADYVKSVGGEVDYTA